jgi:cobaltochelatase CobN
MLISDTTKEIPKAEFVGDVITRGIRTRLLNPKWADELLKHEFHGAQKISDRVEYLIGLSATTNAVENWIWSDVAKRYILDPKMRKRLVLNNKWATAEIVERLLEANKRGYWKATEEEIERLKEAYLEIEGWIEERMGEIKDDFQGGSVDILTAEEVTTWKSKMEEIKRSTMKNKKDYNDENLRLQR